MTELWVHPALVLVAYECRAVGYRRSARMRPYLVMPRGLYSESTAATASARTAAPASAMSWMRIPAMSVGGQISGGGYPCHLGDGLQVEEEQGSGQGCDDEFDQDPIVAEQSPDGAQCLDNAGDQ